MGQPSDDDEPEIEVAALQAPLVRKPRAVNPEVDNVITSGEIAPRSLIIRSQSQPAIQLPVEAAPAPAPRPPPARRLGWLWLVAAAVPALVVIILTVAKPVPVSVVIPTTDLEAVAELIGATFDGDAHAAQVRAEAIASSSMLRAGIETDGPTLDNMTKDKDVVFPIGKTESLEVVQLRDGARNSLLMLQQPAPIKAPAPGAARLDLRNGAPMVVVDAPITTQTNTVGGELVLTATVDLARVKPHLPPRAIASTITGLATPVQLAGTGAPTGQVITLPIHTALASATPLMLVTSVAAAPIADSPMWFRVGRGLGAALAALFVILFLLSLLARRSNG